MKLKSAARLLFTRGAVQQGGAETTLKEISHPASNIQHNQHSFSYTTMKQDCTLLLEICLSCTIYDEVFQSYFGHYTPIFSVYLIHVFSFWRSVWNHLRVINGKQNPLAARVNTPTLQKTCNAREWPCTWKCFLAHLSNGEMGVLYVDISFLLSKDYRGLEENFIPWCNNNHLKGSISISKNQW